MEKKRLDNQKLLADCKKISYKCFYNNLRSRIIGEKFLISQETIHIMEKLTPVNIHVEVLSLLTSAER
jgi:hypothetical protein